MNLPAQSAIRLRGVNVHNLCDIDVDIPLDKLTVLTGVSGSGKSSLAIDTLYAEGQRRYIESFSAQARRHLDRLEKPDVRSIDNLLPAVALRQNSVSRSPMATVGTVTGIDSSLRILFARLGQIVCPGCSARVISSSTQDVVSTIGQQPEGTRLIISFHPVPEALSNAPNSASDSGGETADNLIPQLLHEGFARGLMSNRTKSDATGREIRLEELLSDSSARASIDSGEQELLIVADRIIAGRTELQRVTESVETCFRQGAGRCVLLLPQNGNPAESQTGHDFFHGTRWTRISYSRHLECIPCGREFQPPIPQHLNFHSPAGACHHCLGAGRIPQIDWKILVPDPSRSLERDAITLLSERRWQREKEQLLELCRTRSISISRPFRDLDQSSLATLSDARTDAADRDSPEARTVGLRTLLQHAAHRNQASIRDDLARLAPPVTCPACDGTRLRLAARAIRLGADSSLADVAALNVDNTSLWLADLRRSLPSTVVQPAAALFQDLENRLQFLRQSGLGYVESGRAMSALSLGEARRVSMAAVLGSSLVNTLFVLDEPSAGQHPRDCEQLLDIVQQLRDAGNTIVAVEHQPQFIDAADHLIQLGPGAGRNGGQVVYSGPTNPDPTAASRPDRKNKHRSTGSIRIENCSHNTLQNVSVEIPLGGLCVVAGVSGSGKSSLIEHTLYPALCDALSRPCSVSVRGPFQKLSGVEQIGDVQLVGAERLSGGRRSNPATWLKLFDGIRRLFAETQESRSRDFTPGTFSFNTDSGGRCGQCRGTGSVEIDMQFLSDVVMTCPDCHGTRFKREVLDVTWRGRTIADVLNMTAEEAFSFFRGQPKLQKKLQSLKEVGLDYLTLGQPLSTLSGGEAQRLKLASSLAVSGNRTSLLILTEPAAGLHPTDTDRMLDSFDRLISVGHSLLVIEHNLQVLRAADDIIELGPGAGPRGGRLIAAGSLEEICATPESISGKSLRS